MLFLSLHFKKWGNERKEEKLRLLRIRQKIGRRADVSADRSVWILKSNTVSVCSLHELNFTLADAHTSCWAQLCTNGHKKPGESRCRDEHESQVLIKQKRCRIVNETPSHFPLFVTLAATVIKCVFLLLCPYIKIYLYF